SRHLLAEPYTARELVVDREGNPHLEIASGQGGIDGRLAARRLTLPGPRGEVQYVAHLTARTGRPHHLTDRADARIVQVALRRRRDRPTDRVDEQDNGAKCAEGADHHHE